jgi:hypothetical protein
MKNRKTATNRRKILVQVILDKVDASTTAVTVIDTEIATLL